jgi:hypothetical protein
LYTDWSNTNQLSWATENHQTEAGFLLGTTLLLKTEALRAGLRTDSKEHEWKLTEPSPVEAASGRTEPGICVETEFTPWVKPKMNQEPAWRHAPVD